MGGLGDNIRKLREERGWTLERLSEESGVSKNYLGDIERGVRGAGTKTKEKLCRAFMIEERDLYTGGEREKENPQVPEHLRVLLAEIAEVFPTTSSLVQKSEKLSKVMRELRDDS